MCKLIDYLTFFTILICFLSICRVRSRKKSQLQLYSVVELVSEEEVIKLDYSDVSKAEGSCLGN